MVWCWNDLVPKLLEYQTLQYQRTYTEEASQVKWQHMKLGKTGDKEKEEVQLDTKSCKKKNQRDVLFFLIYSWKLILRTRWSFRSIKGQCVAWSRRLGGDRQSLTTPTASSFFHFIYTSFSLLCIFEVRKNKTVFVEKEKKKKRNNSRIKTHIRTESFTFNHLFSHTNIFWRNCHQNQNDALTCSFHRVIVVASSSTW